MNGGGWQTFWFIVVILALVSYFGLAVVIAMEIGKVGRFPGSRCPCPAMRRPDRRSDRTGRRHLRLR